MDATLTPAAAPAAEPQATNMQAGSKVALSAPPKRNPDSMRLSPESRARLAALPTTRLGPRQRETTRTLDLALGGLQEDAIAAPLPASEPIVDQSELASLGAPFFEVNDPIEAARVNEFRLKYRSFRKGNAKGSKGEMKVRVCWICLWNTL